MNSSFPLPGAVNPEKPRILVADDEPSNRMLLRRVLASRYEVTEAQDGRDALDLIGQQDFDMLLLDVMMPGATGLDVLEQVRAAPDKADLPVILISALADNDDIIRGLRMGANDYIPKPIEIDVVSARVDTHIRLKQMTDLHKQTIAQLQAAQQLKDRLFRIASHDLKSPLSNVALAEMLLRQIVPEDPTVTEILDTLRLTTENMNHVIEEFLDMAATQSGSIDIHLEPVSVQEVVMEVAAAYSITAQKKDIALNLADLPGMVLADRARYVQVLNNLVSNAIKYSPPGSTVTLWAEIQQGFVRTYVADQGAGIPPHERERLFTEFGKLSTRPTGGESSTGLGLWIVKHMATLQGGAVGVECPPEGGSIFWVDLPMVV
jgi:two-component system sensor histidine kinase/response regulator